MVFFAAQVSESVPLGPAPDILVLKASETRNSIKHFDNIGNTCCEHDAIS